MAIKLLFLFYSWNFTAKHDITSECYFTMFIVRHKKF